MSRRLGSGERSSKPRVRPKRLAAIAASGLLILVVCVATALADDQASSDGLSIEALRDVEQAPTSGAVELTDLAAAEELPLESLDREGVVELIAGVFEPIVEHAADPIQVPDVEKYVASNAAIAVEAVPSPPGTETDGPEGESPATERLLVESTVPLLTQDDAGVPTPVDLDLRASGDGLEPRAPLVPLRLPRELGDGIELPGLGIGIHVQQAADDRAPSVLEGSFAVYPNTSPETDFSVVPTPTGLETFTVLRSPEALHTQVLDLELPPGAALRADELGGAEVVDGGEAMLSVLPPFAVDAAGKSVPVTLEVLGNSLAIEAAPAADARYPIMVDPIFESYDWYGSKSPAGQNSWEEYTTPGAEMVSGPFNDGLLAYAEPGFHRAGDQTGMRYRVPRYAAEVAQGRSPTSYIARMNLSHIGLYHPGGGGFAPYVFAGIWGGEGRWAGTPGKEAIWVLAGNTPQTSMNPGWTVQMENGEPGNRDQGAKVAYGIGIATTENVSIPAMRQAVLGTASVEVADDLAPGPANGSVSPWMDQTALATISASAEDSGLGVKKIGFEFPFKAPTFLTNSCAGTVPDPCPLTWNANLGTSQYNPSELPQGIVYLPVIAEDVVGNKSVSGTKATLRIDHTKPTLALSGTLTEQAKVGTASATYNLKVDAADGDPAAPAAQPPMGTPGTGTGQLQRPMGVALDSAGNSYVVDRECKCVQKYDPSGKFAVQFGTPGTGNGQFSDPRGIAVSQEGVWVTDYINKTTQLFSAGGTYSRKLSHNFQQPYAVAAGPGNALWVSDTGAAKVFKFANATGTGTPVTGRKANPGGPPTDLSWPIGLAVDQAGTVWVADHTLNRVLAFGANGKWIGEFGSQGAGNGQFKQPFGLAVAPTTGTILVAEEGNNRIQEFRPNGEYIRQFGAEGPASDQLNLPRGIALALDRTLYIADAANKRIARWTHASFDIQSGVVVTKVKIDNQTVDLHVPNCPPSNCSIGREWELKSDNFSVGQHTLEVTATDGVGLSTVKTMTVETHGDLTPPSVVLSGAMTEQATLGTTRPGYTLKVSATDPGGSEERKSGVASTVIKVDGSAVDTTSPGCPAGSCSITREWTLNSDNYSAGDHAVQVIATDAAGRVTTKSLTITIERDSTPPEIYTTGPFNTLFNRPEGWVEQKGYSYNPVAKDLSGYGVTAVTFRLDGAVVASKMQSCPSGGCAANVLGTLNMASYDGGTHTAEVIANDGAGNTRKRTWTINVDPQGEVSIEEAEDTLEALETTDPLAALIASNDEIIDAAEQVAGNNPELTPTETDFVVQGAPVKTEISTNPGDGAAIPTSEGKVQIAPTNVAAAAMTILTENGSAAVTPNTDSHVDTIARPTYDGLTYFQMIRDAAASETFSWKVKLYSGQHLESFDAQTIQVVFEDGTPVMQIKAESARDATGAEVPTALTVDGTDIVTLHVGHKSAPYVYPVTAGPGFRVGYSSVLVIPPPQPTDNYWESSSEIIGPPEPVPSSEATISTVGESRKKYLRVRCAHYSVYEPTAAGATECGNPFTGDIGEAVLWHMAIRGAFRYKQKDWVEHRNAIDCAGAAYDHSILWYWYVYPAYECHYGPKTSDENGGTKASAGHYLRAQAHWQLGHRSKSMPYDPVENPIFLDDRALELHLWPSGHVEKVVP